MQQELLIYAQIKLKSGLRAFYAIQTGDGSGLLHSSRDLQNLNKIHVAHKWLGTNLMHNFMAEKLATVLEKC